MSPDRSAVLGSDLSGRGVRVPLTLSLAVIFIVAFALYTRLWSDAPYIEGDSAQYLAVANDLADGQLDQLHFRTAGYPLLLALTQSTTVGTRRLFYVSLGLHLATIWMVAVALNRSGCSPLMGLSLAGLLLLPPFVEPAAYLMTENLAQVLLAGGFAAMVFWTHTGRARWATAAGLAFSAVALVRPVYQALTPVLCIGLVILAIATRRSTAKPLPIRAAALVLLVTWIAIVGGYATFNFLRFGWFGLSPSAGMHLTTRTTSFLERAPDEYHLVRDVLIRSRDAELTKPGGLHTGTQAIWAAQTELEAVTGLTMPQLSALLIRMNLSLIRRAPLEYLQEVARSGATYWFPAGGTASSAQPRGLRWLGRAVYGALVLVFFLQLSVVIGIGTLAILRRREAVTLWAVPNLLRPHVFAYGLAVTIIFYTMVVSCMADIGEPRQRRPTDVLLVCACMLAFTEFRRSDRSA